MATLKERIQAELHAALRSRNATRKSTLRLLTAAIHNAEIEARGPLDEDRVLAVIQKQAKQRRESIAEFEKGKRPDLVAREAAELAVLQEYLPQAASPEEIESAARQAIRETGASTPRDLGKVMPLLMQRLAGRVDGRSLSETVHRLLGT